MDGCTVMHGLLVATAGPYRAPQDQVRAVPDKLQSWEWVQ